MKIGKLEKYFMIGFEDFAKMGFCAAVNTGKLAAKTAGYALSRMPETAIKSYPHAKDFCFEIYSGLKGGKADISKPSKELADILGNEALNVIGCYSRNLDTASKAVAGRFSDVYRDKS
ncbi:MAG: hypothetical protein V1886_04025, partial [archaeon]